MLDYLHGLLGLKLLGFGGFNYGKEAKFNLFIESYVRRPRCEGDLISSFNFYSWNV